MHSSSSSRTTSAPSRKQIVYGLNDEERGVSKLVGLKLTQRRGCDRETAPTATSRQPADRALGGRNRRRADLRNQFNSTGIQERRHTPRARVGLPLPLYSPELWAKAWRTRLISRVVASKVGISDIFPQLFVRQSFPYFLNLSEHARSFAKPSFFCS
jgi:hypothetical protein